MKNDENDEAVAFVIDTIPKPLSHALRILAELTYPIDDKAAFEKALSPPDDEEGEMIATLLDHALGPSCFPLASARNAMEKLHANVPERLQVRGGGFAPGFHLDPPVELGPELDLGFPWPSRISKEAFFRWWACRQKCLREFEEDLRNVNPYDPLAGVKEAVYKAEYEKCLKRCGSR